MRPDDPTPAAGRPPGPFDETGPARPGPLAETGPRPGSAARARRPEVPRRGDRVAGLEVLGELGRGGFGVVLRALDPSAGREVALKLMLDPASADAQARFAREGELLARLDHPGVVRVHAAGADEGRPYLVVELVEGARPLDEAAAGAPLAERVRLVRDAARALGHAHARGVVHRDVKPANILVDRGGQVRVTDFGLAAAADLERLTRSGYVVGTPLYLAPEQLRSGEAPLRAATDVWGLGVVLFELVAAGPPFPSTGLADLLVHISSLPAPPLRSAAPDAPPALEAVVARALDRDPARRFADGAALADALDRALAPPAPRGPARGLLALALGLLAGVAAVGVAASAAPRPPAAPGPAAPQAGPAAPPPPAPPPALPRGPSWSAGLDLAGGPQALRAAAKALDAEVAAGRPLDPTERATALKVLAELDRRWRTPAALSKEALEALYELLWTHALWVRLDPSHAVPPDRARALLDAALILVGRPESALVGVELARILPRQLNGYVLHADAKTVDPGNADGAVLRRGLELAEDGPDESWSLLARVLAAWLSRRADQGDRDAEAELEALAARSASRAARCGRAVAHVRALAARHAAPAEARRLLLAAEAAGSGAPRDRVPRALGWWRLARASELEPDEREEARALALETSRAAFEELVSEPEPSDRLLEQVTVELVGAVEPLEALRLLDRALARRPASFPGLALRRVRLLAERGAGDEVLAGPLADLSQGLEELVLSRRLPRALRAWLQAGLVIARAARDRPSDRAAAAREWLDAWAGPDQVRLLDRR